MQKMSSTTVDVLHMRNHARVSEIPATSLVLGKKSREFRSFPLCKQCRAIENVLVQD